MRTEAEIRATLAKIQRDRENEDLEHEWEAYDALIDILRWVLNDSKNA